MSIIKCLILLIKVEVFVLRPVVYKNDPRYVVGNTFNIESGEEFQCIFPVEVYQDKNKGNFKQLE